MQISSSTDPPLACGQWTGGPASANGNPYRNKLSNSLDPLGKALHLSCLLIGSGPFPLLKGFGGHPFLPEDLRSSRNKVLSCFL